MASFGRGICNSVFFIRTSSQVSVLIIELNSRLITGRRYRSFIDLSICIEVELSGKHCDLNVEKSITALSSFQDGIRLWNLRTQIDPY